MRSGAIGGGSESTEELRQRVRQLQLALEERTVEVGTLSCTIDRSLRLVWIVLVACMPLDAECALFVSLQKEHMERRLALENKELREMLDQVNL